MNAPKKILSGMLYMVSGTYLGRLYGFAVSVILLPRLLDAGTMGSVAMGAALFLLLMSMKEMGLSFALLHHQDRIDELAPMHFLLYTLISTLWIGAIVSVFLYLLNFLPGNSFLREFLRLETTGDQLVLWTVICFSCFDLLRSASYTSETRLRASLEFKSIALIHMSGLVLALSATVVLAGNGFGGWALIAGGAAHYVTFSPVYVIWVVFWIWKLQPQRLRDLRWNGDHARLLWRYGKWFWSGGVLYYIVLEAPKIIAGSALGRDVLGYYALAFTWAQLTTGAITHILVGLTNPVYARYQKDRERLSLVFGKMVRLIARIVFLLGAIFFLEADRLITAFSGSDWLPSTSILRWLVLFALFRPFYDDIQALLLAVGTPRTIARINGVQAAFTLIASPILCWIRGIEGIALATGLTAALGILLSIRYVSRYVSISWPGAILKPLLSALILLAVARGLDASLPGSGLLGLAAHLSADVAVFAAVLLLLERRELRDEILFLKEVLRDK